MRLFNKVGIIGMGLMGGSMALGMKKRGLVNRVIGVSRHKETILLAKKNGAIDEGSCQVDIIKDVDLLVLATPVRTILNLAFSISKLIKSDCIVTDVGSTKEEIVSKYRRFFPQYIGSHPLAGSEKHGIINANGDIFKDNLCILTPTKDTDPKVLNKIKRLWIGLGSKVVFLDPSTHDKILSSVSHLPHVVAFSLISAIPSKYLEFSSPSLRDTTRISVSDKQIWLDIFLSNQKNILNSIDLFQKHLLKIKSAIKNRNEDLLNKILKTANLKRKNLE